jgi:hypothetical protein
MIDLRCAICLALVALSIVSLPSAVRAQQSFQRLIPLLIDLPGWAGPPPGDTAEERIGGRVISASRGYMRGDARFNASVTSGNAALATSNSRIFITTKGVTTTSTIDGFQVTTRSTPVFISIVVTLGPDAIFGLLFNNVSEDEAMALARKFDWQAIQAMVN